MRIVDHRKRQIAVMFLVCGAILPAGCGGASGKPKDATSAQDVTTSTSAAISTVSTQSSVTASAANQRVAREKAALAMASCFQERGLHVGPQNPQTGFSMRGMNTSGARFKRAYPECFRYARGIYERYLSK
jgi:hypothetical protein